MPLDNPRNTNCFTHEIRRFIQKYQPDQLIVTQSSEYRVSKAIELWPSKFGIPVDIRSDRRFLCSSEKFTTQASGRKHLRMEYLYREMRKNVLD